MAFQRLARPQPVQKDSPTVGRRLPVLRVGVAGGIVGMLCCVAPTLLALFGVVGAGTAYAWAERLYGGYAWWFRVAGLAALLGLLAVALRRRNSCSVRGARDHRRQIAVTLLAAGATYGVLYAVTTGLGTLA